MTKALREAIDQLKRDPTQPVRTTIEGMAVEMRAVSEAPSPRTAAEAFANVGGWAGESTDEILAILADARREGSRRLVSEL
jgi:hypothetical protein